MKADVKEIKGITNSGRKGTRWESNINIGDRVRDGGRDGTVISDGMAGMPEVEFDDGTSELCFPSQLEIIKPNATTQTPT